MSHSRKLFKTKFISEKYSNIHNSGTHEFNAFPGVIYKQKGWFCYQGLMMISFQILQIYLCVKDAFMFEYKTVEMFEVSEKRSRRENMKWDFALGKPKIGYRSSPIWRK